MKGEAGRGIHRALRIGLQGTGAQATYIGRDEESGAKGRNFLKDFTFHGLL